MTELTRDEIALNAAAMALASSIHGPRKSWKDRDCWKMYLPTASTMLRAHEAEIQMRPTCWECEIEQNIGYCRCEIAAND
jgi:hypothetical protein